MAKSTQNGKRAPRNKVTERAMRSSPVRGSADTADSKGELNCYYLVSESPQGDLECKAFGSTDEFRAAAMQLIAQYGELWMFAFCGQRLHFTEGPYRYIVPPYGEPIPLFEIPTIDAMQIADDGYISSKYKDEDFEQDDGSEVFDEETEELLDSEEEELFAELADMELSEDGLDEMTPALDAE